MVFADDSGCSGIVESFASVESCKRKDVDHVFFASQI